MVGILPYVDRTSQTYKAFAKVYTDANSPPKAANPLFPSVFKQEPNLRAALAFDAVYALVYAIDNVVEQQGFQKSQVPFFTALRLRVSHIL